MKKSSVLYTLMGLLILLSACSKDEVEDPAPINDPTPVDTTGNGSFVEVDVLGLAQNYVKAEGLSVDKIYTTSASVINNGIDNNDYVKLFLQGDIGHNVSVTLKGNAFREGNFSIKRWALGVTLTDSEAIVEVAVRKNGDTALLDFEDASSQALSIIKDENDLFVIKMAPHEGINRNTWQPAVTPSELISFHLSSNPEKLVSSTNPDVYNNTFTARTSYHDVSNQAKLSCSSDKISLTFHDYDLATTASLPNADYTLSSEEISWADNSNGTVPQSVHMSYLAPNWSAWPANYNMSQNITMEMNENSIKVTYTDIEFVNPNDASESFMASGEWVLAR